MTIFIAGLFVGALVGVFTVTLLRANGIDPPTKLIRVGADDRVTIEINETAHGGQQVLVHSPAQILVYEE